MIDPLSNLFDFCLAQRGPVFGHLVAFGCRCDPQIELAIGQVLGQKRAAGVTALQDSGDRIQRQFTFGNSVAVAIETVLAKDRQDVLAEANVFNGIRNQGDRKKGQKMEQAKQKSTTTLTNQIGELPTPADDRIIAPKSNSVLRFYRFERVPIRFAIPERKPWDLGSTVGAGIDC